MPTRKPRLASKPRNLLTASLPVCSTLNDSSMLFQSDFSPVMYEIFPDTNSSNAAIWNATTSYRFMKDEAELKFTAFDMLRQNKNIINFLNQNSIGTTVTNGLRQYFMLSFSFYPRKFGGKANNAGGVMIMR